MNKSIDALGIVAYKRRVYDGSEINLLSCFVEEIFRGSFQILDYEKKAKTVMRNNSINVNKANKQEKCKEKSLKIPKGVNIPKGATKSRKAKDRQYNEQKK